MAKHNKRIAEPAGCRQGWARVSVSNLRPRQKMGRMPLHRHRVQRVHKFYERDDWSSWLFAPKHFCDRGGLEVNPKVLLVYSVDPRVNPCRAFEPSL
jgi:hypothetical protein